MNTEQSISANLSQPRQPRLRSPWFVLIQQSVIWKALLLVATFLLLFGSSIQFIAVPKEGDLAFDVLYTLALVIFVFDMALNVVIDPEYFNFNFCVRRKDEKSFYSSTFTMGSFLFWCDVLSTLSLLFHISYINRREYEMMKIQIRLNEYGVPVNFDTINSNIPVEYDSTHHLLILVCKMARIARLVPSSTVVDISSRLNVYWYLQRINPIWYCRKISERRRERSQKVTERIDVALAARLKAVGVGMKLNRTKRVLQYFGFLPDHNMELKHHLAAMKIQRAWRWKNRSSRISKSGNSGKEYPRDSKPRKLTTKDIEAETQVGRAMAQVTGRRLAITVLMSLLLTILFTYVETDATRTSTMIILHGQTTGNYANSNSTVAEKALNAARRSSVPGLFQYNVSDGESFEFAVNMKVEELREREQVKIVVEDYTGSVSTTGLFIYRKERVYQAYLVLTATIITCLVWFLGVAAFAGPIMALVVTPIERMVRLLGMLTVDPLGYQSNYRFKKFLFEDVMMKESQWTKDILKGMETAFLMSTILRIGNLMKVGFGSAGVEIIKNNLQEGQNKNMLILNERGSTVSCIFLFCDIRQFTDATECLQEEVFVFTNRIAAVVHSFCHSYGGSANKNVGDAFLVSWLLEDDNSQVLSAKHQQADKALLSVVKICMALYYDEYYVETMSEIAKTSLINKLKNRSGPIVQMGFGLHAGKAVQGAIGSQRKIDATYVSEAVEKAEFLESSTKQYGLKMLMSDTFQTLLDPKIRRRCRKIDQVYFPDEDENEDEAYELSIDERLEKRMELFTFDMDIDALWRKKRISEEMPERKERSDAMNTFKKKRSLMNSRMNISTSRVSNPEIPGSSRFDFEKEDVGTRELILPTGVEQYKDRVWLQEDIRLIRQQYTTAVIQDFNSGLQRYYDKDWINAKKYFEMVLARFDDGPSTYFLQEMKEHNFKPPPMFSPIRRVD